MRSPLLAGLLLTLAAGAHAETTPVGLWKTLDDDSHQEKSLVRIKEEGGVLSGRIEKLLDPADPPDARCDKCSDERKNQPVVGLTILRGVKRNADHPERWDGGDILDPDNGKVYRVRLEPQDQGRKLEVRGYIGTPLLGRSQTWVRAD